MAITQARSTTTVGLIHPGQMGSFVGASIVAAGVRVLWASEDRSAATAARAEFNGLEGVPSLAVLVEQSDIVLSVCPPHAAEHVANEVAALGFSRIYVDANAVSPATARRVATTVEAAGATFVDGSIIGVPARQKGETRLYLAGEQAAHLASIFDGPGLLDVISIDGPPGAASALKMAYSTWTKAGSAMLAMILAMTQREGVYDALVAEWEISHPELAARSARLKSSAAKAWRFIGEMEEMADTYEANGLPRGFHEAAAEIYRRLAHYKDDPNAPAGGELAKELLKEESAR